MFGLLGGPTLSLLTGGLLGSEKFSFLAGSFLGRQTFSLLTGGFLGGNTFSFVAGSFFGRQTPSLLTGAFLGSRSASWAERIPAERRNMNERSRRMATNTPMAVNSRLSYILNQSFRFTSKNHESIVLYATRAEGRGLLQKLAFPIDDGDVDVVHPGMVGRGEADIQVAGVIILNLFEGIAKLLASRFWTGTSQAFD